jgi:hypothetical protein
MLPNEANGRPTASTMTSQDAWAGDGTSARLHLDCVNSCAMSAAHRAHNESSVLKHNNANTSKSSHCSPLPRDDKAAIFVTNGVLGALQKIESLIKATIVVIKNSRCHITSLSLSMSFFTIS